MRTRITGLVLVATLGASGLLAACGSDDTDKASVKEKSSETTAEAPETEGATDEPTEDAATENGDKPAREDVVEGYAKVTMEAGEQTGLDMPEDVVTKVVACFVDAVYDEASAKTLQALADSDVASIDPADAALFSEAQVSCQQTALN